MNDSQPIYYISRNEFIKRLLELNKSIVDLGVVYTTKMIEAENEKKPSKKHINWLKKQIDEIGDDVKHNNEMIMRAKIEKDYNLFWVDIAGNMLLRRCTKKEHDEIYKRRETKYIF